MGFYKHYPTLVTKKDEGEDKVITNYSYYNQKVDMPVYKIPEDWKKPTSLLLIWNEQKMECYYLKLIKF